MPHALEIFGRVTVVYAFCVVLLRLVGRREMSELGPMDLMAMLLLSETVSNSITGGDDSLATGLIAAASLLGLTHVSDRLSFRFRRFERLVQGEAVVLVRNGRADPRVMRRFLITDDDLAARLHENGLTSVEDIDRAFVESDGKITMIRKPENRHAS